MDNVNGISNVNGFRHNNIILLYAYMVISKMVYMLIYNLEKVCKMKAIAKYLKILLYGLTKISKYVIIGI